MLSLRSSRFAKLVTDRSKRMVEIKDLVYLVIGVAVGFIAGIAMYWLPLRQFGNEFKSLWNLVRRRYQEGAIIKLKPGTRFKPLSSDLSVKEAFSPTTATVYHDEGIGWHHTRFGWSRARILHVFVPGDDKDSLRPIYRVCHYDIDYV
jgi:hypothetical protein